MRQRRPSSTPRRSGRHAVEAQVFVDLDHAVNLVVPVVPQGFRASYEQAAPRKEGILVTAEASSSRSKNKVSHTLSTIFVVLNWMFDSLTTIKIHNWKIHFFWIHIC